MGNIFNLIQPLVYFRYTHQKKTRCFMKILSLLFLLTLNSYASEMNESCEVFSYQKTINDYSGDCASLIIDAAVEHKCSTEELKKVRNRTKYAIQTLSLNSTTFCKMESMNGYYSVMKDDMTEPPVATVYFSRWD